ncbi:MAG: PsaJ protein [Goleter apudmare HA4340-LM2]|nr:PsaJ protein [Goleter apudmare HA4340-LM2]
MRTQNKEKAFFLRYLSLAPVIAILSISVALSTWIIFNYFFPDLLFHPMP